MNPHTISSYMPWLPIGFFQHGEVLPEAGFAIPLQPILGVNNAQSIKCGDYGEAGVQLFQHFHRGICTDNIFPSVRGDGNPNCLAEVR
jgi:hypothetical protein